MMQNLTQRRMTIFAKKLIFFAVILCAAIYGMNVLPAKADSPTLTLLWQTKLDHDSVLAAPADIAVDKWGNVYVSTQGSNEIKKFDSDGNFLLKWGKGGKGKGGFNLAFGMATDSDGNVYVTDFYNKLIQKFDDKGNFLQEWATEPTTSPAFMAIDTHDNIYIDQFPPYDTHYILKFDKNGKFVSEWGKPTLPINGRVEDIAVDKQGNLYVTEAFSHRIHKIDPNGKLLTSFGGQVSSKGEGRFDVPAGITIDAEGNLYVIDTNFLQKLDKDGKFVAQWPRKGDLEDALNITVDAQGNLYILAKTEVKTDTDTPLKVWVLKKFQQSW